MDEKKINKPEQLYLSEIIDAKIIFKGKKIGKLTDLTIVETGKVPEVNNIVVSRPFGYKSLLIPNDKIKFNSKKEIELEIESIEQYEKDVEPEIVLLKDHILDKKVIDMEDNEVEVVYDVKLIMKDSRIYVVAVDFSKYGMLRRFGMTGVAHKIYDRAFIAGAKGKVSHSSKILYKLANKVKEKTIPWAYIQPLSFNVDSFKGNVKLNVLKENLSDIPPVDLADIVEELDNEQRLLIFEHLDTEHASDTLEEIDPNVQREIVSSLRREKVAQLINEMTPAQAADVLGVLPTATANSIMELLEKDDVEKIKSIIEQHEEEILDYSTQDFIKQPPDKTVGEVQNNFPSIAKDKDVIMYVYIVDKYDKLLGILDLKEILQANDDALLKDVMVDNVISLEPVNTLKEASVMFARYGFRAIPVLDENERILGVVPQRDILNLKHRFVE